MNFEKKIKEAAEPLGLLNADGSLKQIDSLGIIELIDVLERTTGVILPAASLREEAFESVGSLSDLLKQFSKEKD